MGLRVKLGLALGGVAVLSSLLTWQIGLLAPNLQWIGVLLALLLSLGTMFSVGYWVAQPLEALRQAIQTGQPSSVDIHSRDEVGLLAQALHQLTATPPTQPTDESWQLLIDNAPFGIAMVDLEGKILFANARVANIVARTDLTGTSCYDLINPEHHAKLAQAYSRVVQHGDVVGYEVQINPATNQACWLAGQISAIQRNDAASALLVMTVDVSERKQAEVALEHHANRTEAFFQAFPDLLLFVDKDGRHVDYQPKHTPINWYPAPEAMVGRTVAEVLPPNIGQQMMAAIRATLETGAPQHLEYDLKLQHRMRGYEARLVASQDEEVLIFVRDITEARQTEQALKAEQLSLEQRIDARTAELSLANAELTRTARLKDEFLANMSHELRTPLNAIIGMTDILAGEVYGKLNEQQANSLRIINESGTHLLSLITDILDLSRINAGKLKLSFNDIPVDSLCQASVRLVKKSAHEKKIKIITDLDEQVAIFQADPVRLKQILVNLLANAVKFTPEGGEMGLKVTGDVQERAVYFEVWDTGIGMSDNEITQLFQPFVQLDSSLSRQYEGTGLGLALVYRLSEMHGGSVQVESKKGVGSRFTVSLPWREAKLTSAARVPSDEIELAPARPPTGENNNHILLVEDNEANIDMITTYLVLQGYRVTTARNGAEAIDRAKEGQPDIILMDVQMPVLDGIEATKKLRADTDTAQVPILALTALAMPGDRERCLAAGATDYFSKPVDMRRLLKSIRRYTTKTETNAAS